MPLRFIAALGLAALASSAFLLRPPAPARPAPGAILDRVYG